MWSTTLIPILQSQWGWQRNIYSLWQQAGGCPQEYIRAISTVFSTFTINFLKITYDTSSHRKKKHSSVVCSISLIYEASFCPAADQYFWICPRNIQIGLGVAEVIVRMKQAGEGRYRYRSDSQTEVRNLLRFTDMKIFFSFRRDGTLTGEFAYTQRGRMRLPGTPETGRSSSHIIRKADASCSVDFKRRSWRY